MALPLRAELQGLTAYGAPQLNVPVRLNTNENPFPPPPALVEAIADAVRTAAGSLNRYPDRDFTGLRRSLAAYLTVEAGVAVEADMVWAANGSNEVMQQILQAFGGPDGLALTFDPTYLMYEEYARNTNTPFVTVDRLPDFSLTADLVIAAIEQHRPTVVFFASPNNPTGTTMDLEVLDAALAAAPNTVVVVDEAYAEFRRPGTDSALTRLAGHPNLVVCRTMSKAFAFAGVRLGYLASSREVISGLKLVRLPYHLSSVTQAVAETALAFAGELQKHLSVLRSERDSIVNWLRTAGYQAVDSDANFVLFGPFPDRHAVWQALVDRGVLIREVGPAGWLRVSIGTPAEMLAFKDALTEVKAEGL